MPKDKRLTQKQVAQIKRDLRFTDYGDLSVTGRYSYEGRYVGQAVKADYDEYGNMARRNPKHDRALKLLGVNSYARRGEVTKRLKRIGPLATTQQPIVLRQAAPSAATLNQVVKTITEDGALNTGIEALKERAGEFSSPEAMALAGIANCDAAREYFDKSVDAMFADGKLPSKAPEVIIGGGFHAAVYCNVRVAMGFPKPIVLERSNRVGGAFAVTREPSFYLNSRNRPGDLGIPGREEALNVLPSGVVQPADLSGDEFQRNSDLAFCVRASLAMNARVFAGKQVKTKIGTRLYLEDAEKGYIDAGRVINATGLGSPIRPEGVPTDHQRILSFNQFMERLDQPFPLRGMKNVAVVGSGDSGKAVIEALMGQGPGGAMSVATLDFVEQVDWYGLQAEETTASGWLECNRARYRGIASNLPLDSRRPRRIKPFTDQARQIAGGYDGALVNGRRYDHVIWVTGFKQESPIQTVEMNMMGRTVAKQAYETDVAATNGYRRTPEYVVGPAAQIPLDSYEGQAIPANVPENSVALFRYAERTATLAANLPEAGTDDLTEV